MGKLLEEPGNYPNASRKDQSYGSIIVVSSTASVTSDDGSGREGRGPCLTMSAHAALGVVRSGVKVLKGSGVRINCISPGGIVAEGRGVSADMAMNNGLERAGTPTEVARVAGFLASGFSAFITGQNLVVDGGATVMGGVAT